LKRDDGPVAWGPVAEVMLSVLPSNLSHVREHVHTKFM
jgi:hypothetical protein